MKALERIIIAAAAAAAMAGCSLFDSEAPVRDLRFEVDRRIAWDHGRMAYTLTLSLSEGEDGDYGFEYGLGDDPGARLLSEGGSPVENAGTVSLARGRSLLYVLPPVIDGPNRTLVMRFSREGVGRAYSMALPDTRSPGFDVSVDPDPAMPYTRVSVTSVKGTSVTAFTVSFTLDGEPFTGIRYSSHPFGGTMELDFSQKGTYEFEMPYLLPGEHLLRVDVSSALGSETASVPFTEPQRGATILHFSYDPFSGSVLVESSYNPLPTRFDFTVRATVRGWVRYNPPQFLGTAELVTEQLCESGQASASLTPGSQPQAVDGGLLGSLLDKVSSNGRETASNWIGSANRYTIYPEISSVSVDILVGSQGPLAGRTPVSAGASGRGHLPVQVTYGGPTPEHGALETIIIIPEFTINGNRPGGMTL